MRMPTNFHDYYDNLLYLFQDEVEPVYIRKMSTIMIPITVPVFSYSSFRGLVRVETVGVIGFCGDIYPLFKADFLDKELAVSKSEYIYDIQRMLELEKEYSPAIKEKYHTMAQAKKHYEELFHKIKHSQELQEIFVSYKTPTFFLEVPLDRCYDYYDWGSYKKQRNLIINPNLSVYHFQKVKDPYSAIQDIHMFLTNNLATESNLPVDITDDEVIKAAKGFGHKYAFKQEPGKKKRRKKKV